MTELAYMIRSDWAQHGTAMGEQSEKVRAWLGGPPFIFFTPRFKRFNDRNSADREFAEFVAPEDATRHVFDIGELADVGSSDGINSAVTVIHPFESKDCELLLEAVTANSVARMFVIVWSESDRVRVTLDALGAVDLHTGERAPAPDAVQLEAARLMVDEQYNGLSFGRGKDAVIQLLRAFREEGDPLDERAWLHALYAAGGTFSSGEAVARFIREMKAGTRHRVQQRFVPGIVDLLRAEARPSLDAR